MTTLPSSADPVSAAPVLRPRRSLRQRLRTLNVVCGMVAHLLLTTAAVLIVLGIWWRSFGGGAPSAEDARREARALLEGLKVSLTEHGGAESMQALFPEGSCFTWTLYGLAAANLYDQMPADSPDRAELAAEVRRALNGQMSPASLSPFGDTEVRLGVFWLGQRNLLLGRYLELTPETQRPLPEVTEFHQNSEELFRAFGRSRAAHLDSYPGMCWPADNVTALASLLIHDEIYGTNYRTAFEAWKNWTVAHACPLTGLPAGHLHSNNGQHIESARGCATSWILPLIMEMDPDWGAELYRLYQEQFRITRLGFRMFREWPKASTATRADVDSGPILWGAGVTATGAGLAGARSAGNFRTETDIRDLSRMFGWPETSSSAGKIARRHCAGLLPVGDAFLAWGWSIPGENTNGREAVAASRPSFHLAILAGLSILAGQYAILLPRSRRRLRAARQSGTPPPEISVPVP